MTSIEVPDGYVLVPARMELTPENMEALAFMLGGDPDAKDADERWNGGTLWVGETVGDNGEKYYGLNVANVECYEEGSIPIVEFAAAPAASGGEDDPYAFSESRREHEAACRDRMNVSGVFKAHPPSGASVSERARNMLSAAYREADMHEHAYNLTHYPRTTTSEQEVALSAIERALSSPRQEGEVVYQFRDGYGAWRDTTKSHYEADDRHDKRILYTHPSTAASTQGGAGQHAIRNAVDALRMAAASACKKGRKDRYIEARYRLESLLTSPTTGADGELP
jgi:hypothetical protein